MCTFSFVPTRYGYYAAMNRDERLTRPRGFVPQLFQSGDLLAVYPTEPGRGTWIASNERGITLALLNWNLPERGGKIISRGSVIPQLIGHSDMADVAWKLSSISLEGILPFRLVGIFWPQDQICEFRWDGLTLQRFSFPWEARHWFSSGVSDEAAGRVRGEACQIAWADKDSGSLPWLRSLHASHVSDDGAYGICVHRPDAATVSYSEIEFRPSALTFRYVDGSPCSNPESISTLRVPLVFHQDLVVA
ncbi:MAG TPA: NRDE family protein [Terriglobales bacterium]|nr:NRDE family protein [Terriglobales bacterium]